VAGNAFHATGPQTEKAFSADIQLHQWRIQTSSSSTYLLTYYQSLLSQGTSRLTWCEDRPPQHSSDEPVELPQW